MRLPFVEEFTARKYATIMQLLSRVAVAHRSLPFVVPCMVPKRLHDCVPLKIPVPRIRVIFRATNEPPSKAAGV